MPALLTHPQRVTLAPNTAIGFCGKIPARGDFVRSGLPQSFIEPWDDWIARAISASRRQMAEDWLPAWLDAPVWRFALAAGVCGPDPTIGLWMPSVDRASRYFPLTFAAIAADCDPHALMAAGGGFLDRTEELGREVLDRDLTPAEIASRLAAVTTTLPAGTGAALPWYPEHGAVWWNAGAPRVAAGVFTTAALPDDNLFCAMLGASLPGTLPLCPNPLR